MSMKTYAEELTGSGFTVRYFDSFHAATKDIFLQLKDSGIRHIHLTDPTDYLLERRIRRFALKSGITITWHESPQFLTTRSYGLDYFKNKKKFFLTEFYIEQRKRFHILMNEGQPDGGQWTFDTENRKRIPKSQRIPELPETCISEICKEACEYIERNFKNNPGHSDALIYPYTRTATLQWLNDFLNNRFQLFGTYQDAIVSNKNFLFHSMLTPMLNGGLITPDDILQNSITVAEQHNIPINSLEGFVRQILGWREFVRHIYELRGTTQRTKNFWNHSRKIPSSFYNGTTGIEPVDQAIKRCIDAAYTHHIERLMVVGNFMLLCEFDPDEVYQWFMEFFIDAYDWVMVPNVYGMSQFADGGLMSTKPYISGSNYILKMSDYQKGEWCEIWDALYWRFIYNHRSFFLRNPRMSMMVRQVEKMDPGKFSRLMQIAEKWFSKMDQEQMAAY